MAAKTSLVLRKRLRRWLDAALCRGAFEASGSLAGLSADAIADGIAAEWQSVSRGGTTWFPAATADAETLTPWVQRWLEQNQ